MRNKGRIVFLVLIVTITLITFILGNLVFDSDLKACRQNVIGVELADFIYNTDYSMRFGKQIDTFYGMDDQLHALREEYDDMLDLYIVSDSDSILFSTSEKTPEHEICSISAGESMIGGDSLYCMFELNDGARVLVRTARSSINEASLQHSKNMAMRAAIGGTITIVLILFFSFVIKNSRRASVVSTILLVIWIVTFGIMIGRNGYIAYRSSINTVFDSVEYAIHADFDRLKELGVPDDELHDVEGYLQRYSDMIPEIDEVRIEGGDIRFEKSRSHESKILLDYILQTVLLLSFSLIVITEEKMYSKNKKSSEEAARDGTS